MLSGVINYIFITGPAVLTVSFGLCLSTHAPPPLLLIWNETEPQRATLGLGGD